MSMMVYVDTVST